MALYKPVPVAPSRSDLNKQPASNVACCLWSFHLRAEVRSWSTEGLKLGHFGSHLMSWLSLLDQQASDFCCSEEW
eukprot:CAMPEP_0171589824 /NCGR_PEP_ID=MMETSP0961-20121227/15122_1 /TAXON_ID=87120 /ORGANISM="Aurantiochytrium limacinum, Strain ATCCMYA-1381" /LENGTH=74 /DNA_ID=CAMNT_0012149283 /DNA_START=994 /DNA_END=1215 /DNA_ORIENTATION=-